jgi:excisionase family DNA binding protein
MRLPIDTGITGLTRPAMEQSHDNHGEFNWSENVQLEGPLCTSEVRLLTVVEVAKLLGISRSKVYELLYAGEIKSVKIGGSRRIRYTDLGDYVRYLDDAS